MHRLRLPEDGRLENADRDAKRWEQADCRGERGTGQQTHICVFSALWQDYDSRSVIYGHQSSLLREIIFLLTIEYSRPVVLSRKVTRRSYSLIK